MIQAARLAPAQLTQALLPPSTSFRSGGSPAPWAADQTEGQVIDGGEGREFVAGVDK